MAEASRRLFLALWPDEAVARALDAAGLEAHRLCGGRRMRRDTLHLTLAFIGDVPETRLSGLVEALGAVAGEAFRLEVDKLGYWRHNRIVWAGCAGRPAALDRLVADLRRSLSALGLPADDTPFVPHVSLLRKAVEAGALPALGPIAWPAAEFVLMESCLSDAGARYRRIAGWRLGASGVCRN